VLRYCNSDPAARGLRATAELGRQAFELYDELERAGLRAGMTSNGLLHVFGQGRSAERSLASAAGMRRYGYAVPVGLLTGTELRELEPALSRRAQAGYLIKEERRIDPARLTAGLAELARRNGVEIRQRAEVTHLDRAGDNVRAIRSSRDSVRVKTVVIAGGASTAELLRPLGVTLPLTAGKGLQLLAVPARSNRHKSVLPSSVDWCRYRTGCR
jgi:D-amino-acid dehydrogenase